MNMLGRIYEPQSFPSDPWSLLISIRISVKSTTIPPAKYADDVAASEDGKEGYYNGRKVFFFLFSFNAIS